VREVDPLSDRLRKWDALGAAEEDLMKQRIVNVGKPVPMPPSSGKSKKDRSKMKAAKQARKKQRGRR
jgi:hypothetical protein